MAIKSWGCNVGDILNATVVYPDALFGDDVKLSDKFVPQFDDAPGASMGVCLEGGVQSFLQVLNMLNMNIPVHAVENLRGLSNAACAVNKNFVPYFLTEKFLVSISSPSLSKNDIQRLLR